MVPFKELAVIVATGRDNSILCYPAVETIHRDNICHIVKASANESRKIMKLETDIYSRPFSSSEGIGVFTVEIFLTGDGELCFMSFKIHILLYEVAPRPHNRWHCVLQGPPSIDIRKQRKMVT